MRCGVIPAVTLDSLIGRDGSQFSIMERLCSPSALCFDSLLFPLRPENARQPTGE